MDPTGAYRCAHRVAIHANELALFDLREDCSPCKSTERADVANLEAARQVVPLHRGRRKRSFAIGARPTDLERHQPGPLPMLGRGTWTARFPLNGSTDTSFVQPVVEYRPTLLAERLTPI